MISRSRQFLSSCIPQIMIEIYRRYVQRSGYFGNFTDYDKARQVSSGYDSELILEKVSTALQKVKSGHASYERDSVLFDDIQYSWPLLAGLLWIASRNGNRLSIIDFGGSLGSSYFQNRMLLAHLKELSWNVVEQENFVRRGRAQYEDDSLRFFYSIEESLSEKMAETILLSSVLPYLEHPYEFLSQLLRYKFEYVLIDRTPMIDGLKDRLTVQRVPATIYKASYPAWILGSDKLLSLFESDYDLVCRFDALAGSIFLGSDFAKDRGFIFKRKS